MDKNDDPSVDLDHPRIQLVEDPKCKTKPSGKDMDLKNTDTTNIKPNDPCCHITDTLDRLVCKTCYGTINFIKAAVHILNPNNEDSILNKPPTLEDVKNCMDRSTKKFIENYGFIFCDEWGPRKKCSDDKKPKDVSHEPDHADMTETKSEP